VYGRSRISIGSVDRRFESVVDSVCRFGFSMSIGRSRQSVGFPIGIRTMSIVPVTASSYSSSIGRSYSVDRSSRFSKRQSLSQWRCACKVLLAFGTVVSSVFRDRAHKFTAPVPTGASSCSSCSFSCRLLAVDSCSINVGLLDGSRQS
jgi:hypothetical protein